MLLPDSAKTLLPEKPYNMTYPSLSIITPSYNQCEFLEENINSVRCQNYPNVEHIIVDGGSDDGTVDLLKEYEEEYDLTWVSEPDRGQSHAINKGIEMASGEWIGWQNSDDFYLPNAFKRFAQTAATNPQSDIVCGDLLVVDEFGEEIGRKYTVPPSKFIQRHWSLFTSNQALFLKRGVFETVGVLNEEYEYTMDADLFWRITNSDLRISIVPEFLGAIRKHEEAKTSGDGIPQQTAEAKRIYQEPWWEELVPQRLLEFGAQVGKLLYLLRNKRWDALKWNLTQKR